MAQTTLERKPDRSTEEKRGPVRAERPSFRWRTLLAAGLLAGTVFLALEALTSLVLGLGTPLGPAQITLREILGLDPGWLTTGNVIVVLLFHFALSLLTTGVLVAFVRTWRRDLATAVGAVYGAFLYVVNFIGFGSLLAEPAMGDDLVIFFDYIVYGMAAAWIYTGLARKWDRR